MRNSIPLLRVLAVIALLLGTSTIASAWIARPAARPGEALEAAMHQIDESMKALSKGVNAENRTAMLEELAKLETALMSAKAQSPDSAEKVEEKKRPAFVNDFKKALIETMQFALAAEIAVLDGKYKEADTLIRNKLGGAKSSGHGKFKTD